SFDTAASAYAATVILLTVALAWVALRAARERPTLATTAGLGALLLVSRPGQMNAINGNITAQVVLGAYAALVCAHRRTALAATGLALALMKPTIGLPLAAFLLFGRGDRRAVVLGTLAAAVASAVVVALILPPAGGVAGLVASVRHGVEAFRLARETTPVSGWMRIDALAVLGKLARRPLPAPVEAAVSLAILGAGLIGVRRFLAAGGAAEAPVVTALICLTIAVFTYQQAYGALLLVLPMLALERDAPPLVGARRLVVVGLMAVPFANYLSTYTVLEHLGVHGWKFLVLTSANGVALVVAWTVVLVLPWVGALLYRVVGYHEAVLRLLSALCAVAHLLLFAWLATTRLPPGGALVATAAVAVNPLLVYFATAITPESLATLVGLGAVVLLLRGRLAAAGGAMGGATLVKPQAACLLPLLLWRGWREPRAARLAVTGLLAVVPPLAWY